MLTFNPSKSLDIHTNVHCFISIYLFGYNLINYITRTLFLNWNAHDNKEKDKIQLDIDDNITSDFKNTNSYKIITVEINHLLSLKPKNIVVRNVYNCTNKTW